MPERGALAPTAATTPPALAGGAASTLSRTARDLSSVDPLAAGLAHWLDSAFRVPGTNLRFGLDAILGLVAPGVGDLATGGLGTYLFFVALRRQVPLVVIARMGVNVLVDTAVGSVPLVGDLFDFAWKSNAKNLDLLREHAGRARPPGLGDYAVVFGVSAVVLGLVLLPVVLVGMLGLGLSSLFSGGR